MSAPNKYQPTNNLPSPPRCPHCAADLSEVNTYQWDKSVQGGQGLAITFVIYCINSECRKLLGTQTFFVAVGSEPSPIARPH